MHLHNLYADATGESHFRDIEIDCGLVSRAGKLSERLPASGIIFREVPADYDLDCTRPRVGNTSSTLMRGCGSPRAMARAGSLARAK